MGTRAVERGPVALRVTANVRALREGRNRMSLADLSARLAEIGRPILPSGLSKIESGERRVDVDDLVALAIALDTTPNRLLLTPDADEAQVGLTTKVGVTSRAAWGWAVGERPLPPRPGADPRHFDLDRSRRFGRENRPHQPVAEMSIQEADQRRAELQPLVDAYRAARDSGISPPDLLAYLQLIETGRALADRADAAREGEAGNGER